MFNCFITWVASFDPAVHAALISLIGTLLVGFLAFLGVYKTFTLGRETLEFDTKAKRLDADIALRKENYISILDSAYKILSYLPQLDKIQSDPLFQREITSNMSNMLKVSLIGTPQTIELTIKFHSEVFKVLMDSMKNFCEISLKYPYVDEELNPHANDQKWYMQLEKFSVLEKIRDQLKPLNDSLIPVIASMRKDLHDERHEVNGDFDNRLIGILSEKNSNEYEYTKLFYSDLKSHINE
ncbi:hypothetical protein ACIKP9_03075 [Methylobacillus methanolivorans]|uniref:Uncharacterized protein n=1 Tax=Methylobacillus methanolivorans TaxID=1848927 RepID=A0ABW8GMP2_9PROT